MSLVKYNKKRKFNETPEPKGRVKKSAKSLHFVVQKHAASHLHYDFRLEMNGVLKSWAVPKGPSMNHNDKRLAIQVEDHPLDYAKFEGMIPKGNYGAGSVEIWDDGFYTPIEIKPNEMKIVLFGKKLKGGFALVKMIDQSWLLIKERDEYAKN